MSDLKVHLMHAEVSDALERLSKLFKPGMKISFIARLPGNGEADVLIGDDHDADELIALVRRRFGIGADAESAGAQNADQRFYMDHGVWHDSVTGQHLWTQDQYDEQWRAMYKAGQEDAANGFNMLTGKAITPTAGAQNAEAIRNQAETAAARDVLAERRRQVEQEGWTPERDDKYINCELARAAATYATCSHIDQLKLCGEQVWPWHLDWWKRSTYRRDLTKAGALILAEIERLDRDAIRALQSGTVSPASDAKGDAA